MLNAIVVSIRFILLILAGVLRKKDTQRFLILRRRFFPARIRDAGHRESTSLQLGNCLECSVVGLVAPPSANSDLVFLVQDWSVGGRDCTTGEFNTHKTDVSVVRYPWHPWFGGQVTIRCDGRHGHGTATPICAGIEILPHVFRL